MCKNCKSSIIINYNYVCIESRQKKGIVKGTYKCKYFKTRTKEIYIKVDLWNVTPVATH